MPCPSGSASYGLPPSGARPHRPAPPECCRPCTACPECPTQNPHHQSGEHPTAPCAPALCLSTTRPPSLQTPATRGPEDQISGSAENSACSKAHSALPPCLQICRQKHPATAAPSCWLGRCPPALSAACASAIPDAPQDCPAGQFPPSLHPDPTACHSPQSGAPHRRPSSRQFPSS